MSVFWLMPIRKGIYRIRQAETVSSGSIGTKTLQYFRLIWKQRTQTKTQRQVRLYWSDLILMKFKSKNQTILYYIRIKNFYFPLCLRPGLTDSGRTGQGRTWLGGTDRNDQTCGLADQGGRLTEVWRPWLSGHLIFCLYRVFGVENFYSDIFVIELLIFLLLLFLPVILSISVFYLYQSEHAKSLPDLNRNLTNTIELGRIPSVRPYRAV